MSTDLLLRKSRRKNISLFTILLIVIFFLTVISVFVGSSNMSIGDVFDALFFNSTAANNRIVWQIRMPRIIAALVAGAGLSISGLIMQTTLQNDMASPATLGVSNAAVFGANLSIIAFAGGFLSTGNNLNQYLAGINIYATSLMAFVFAILSILLVLGLCKIKNFSPTIIALAGIAIGYIWNAATTILQFFATDVGLSAAVIWNFGDLGRATYKSDLFMFIVVFIGFLIFMLFSWKYNALLSGEDSAKTMGINVKAFRFISLLVASLITAICVSMLGTIGFIGIICPHIMKRIIGNDHRILIPSSFLSGSILLLFSDVLSRTIGNGTALPVGAITSLIGAPFFLFIIFSRGKNNAKSK